MSAFKIIRISNIYVSTTILMKRLNAIIFLLTVGYLNPLLAQQQSKINSTPLRSVVGVVKDTAGNVIQGVNVKLLLPKDTLQSVSSINGNFAFNNISAINVTLKFEMLGYQTRSASYFIGDAKNQFVTQPVVLKQIANLLKEVVIKSTPTIIFKQDTTEYFASDYAMQKRDRVMELIEKMQGVTVDNDGKVRYNGEEVLAAKLNGRLYEGGELANAIKSLPAEIVAKIQFIDDYGEKAEATGVKSEAPVKVLNIVTRTDKSVGNRLKLGAASANNKSYQGDVDASRMNKNLNYSAKFKTANDLQGIPSDISSTVSPTSGGNNQINEAAFNYGNTFKQGDLAFRYNYAASKSSMVNNLFNETYTTYGSIFSDIVDNSKNTRKSNNGFANFTRKIGANGTLKVFTNFDAGNSDNDNQRTTDKTGSIINQQEITQRSNETKNGNFSTRLNYTQKLNKANRNINVEASYRTIKNENPEEQVANFYSNSGQTLDSLLHRYFERKNTLENFASYISFTEALNKFQRIRTTFSADHQQNNVIAITNQLDNNGYLNRLYELDNIYNYGLTKSRLSFNYMYDDITTHRFFTSSITLQQAVLNGNQVANIAQRKQFNTFISLSGRKGFNKRSSISARYSRYPGEIDFLKLYAVPNVNSPQHYIIGNPNLKVDTKNDLGFSINLNKSGQSASAELRGNLINDAVINNNTQIFENGRFLRNETSYINATSPDYNLSLNYTGSKNVKMGYIVDFDGKISYKKSPTMNNNVLGNNLQTNLAHSLKLRVIKKIFYQATVRHNYLKNNNTVNQFNMVTNRIQTELDIRYQTRKMLFETKLSKNFIYGMNFNQTKNPFVINAQYDLSVMKGLINLSVIAYDLLKQNNMMYLQFSDLGKSETRSNLSSRFFVFKTSLNLQKWTAAKSKNGEPMIRKGDGTFM
jgi:hypothetical protein